MIVTFPRFGHTAEIMALFFEEMGIPYVKPPINDNDILKLGAEISPEEICLPFKYMAGNLIKAHQAGADTAVMMATCGPCRLGEYGELLREVLNRAGYGYRWIIIDSPAVTGINEFFRRIGLLLGEKNNSGFSTVKCIIKAVKLIMRIDSVESRLKKLNGYTVPPGVCVELLRQLEKEIMNFRTLDEGLLYLRKLERKIRSIDVDKTADPVKILIAGEIYTSIEKSSNGRLEDKLMQMGCSVERHMTVSWWIKNTLKRMFTQKYHITPAKRKPFAYDIGGYGKDTANTIMKAHNFSGVVKIMPSGCMPEIVTKAFCEKTEADKEIKILHLIYDEMSGEAGYETRIEAFADMLERRKYVLAWHRHRIHKH